MKKIMDLKAERVRNGLSQSQLAAKLNISQFTYNRKENGIVDFSLEEVKKLKKELKLTSRQINNIFFKD